MKILLVNDDGINFKGIRFLEQAFSKDHEVILVAPSNERSGFSHSVTIFSPISYTKLDGKNEEYSVDGTPADCIKLAVLYLLKDRLPDFIISGINSGPNLGCDTMYSGTVGAAAEGVFMGIPSIAVSLGFWTQKDPAYIGAADFIKRNLDTLYRLSKKHQGKALFNINYPISGFKGVRFTKTGINSYDDFFDFVEEEKGKVRMQLKGQTITHRLDKGDCDVAYIKEGYATITPLMLDKTCHKLLKNYKQDKTIKFT